MYKPNEYDGGRFSFGNFCEMGESCSFATILIVGGIAFFLIGGMAAKIMEKGLLKGIYESDLFALLFFFGGMFGVIYILTIAVSTLNKTLGKPYSFIPLLIFLLLIHLWRRCEQTGKVKKHQPIVKEEKIEPKVEAEDTHDLENKNIDYDIPPSWRKPK